MSSRPSIHSHKSQKHETYGSKTNQPVNYSFAITIVSVPTRHEVVLLMESYDIEVTGGGLFFSPTTTIDPYE